MNMRIIYTLISYIFIISIQTGKALALTDTAPNVLFTEHGVTSALIIIMNYLFSIFLVVSVIMMIYAAFYYLYARGNTEKVSDARRAFIWSVVAIAIAVIARSVPTVIGALLGADINV